MVEQCGRRIKELSGVAHRDRCKTRFGEVREQVVLAETVDGPVETLLHVRSSSQQVRESIELKMARKYLADLDPNGKLNLDRVIPERFLFGSKSEPPLSWHLTKQQKREIGAAWAADPVNKASWENVRTKLGCSSNPDILNEAIEAKEDDE